MPLDTFDTEVAEISKKLAEVHNAATTVEPKVAARKVKRMKELTRLRFADGTVREDRGCRDFPASGRSAFGSLPLAGLGLSQRNVL